MKLPKEFLERVKNNIPDYEEFVKSYGELPVKSFFVNTSKISKESFLKHCDWNISSYANGYILKDDIKVGKTAEHHSGMIYMQELSAMMPVSFLPLKQDDLVLDMCSAPGGKSIQVANCILKGCLVSNEVNRQRANILRENVERMGLKNVCVINNDPKELEKCFGGMFDAVVVDAPCSGEGMFRKDDDAILNWSVENVKACASRQSLILESADKMLKQGGYLLYSTCTFSVEEDEGVVAQFCKKFNYEIIPLKYDNAVGGCVIDGFKTDGTLKFFPHKFCGEGQFVALLRKRNESECFVKTALKFKKLKDCRTEYGLFEKFCKSNLNSYQDFLNDAIINNNDIYYPANLKIAESGVRLVNCGVKLGEIAKGRFEPDHNLAKSFDDKFLNKVDLNQAEASKYLRGEILKNDVQGYVVLTYKNVPLGLGKGVDGVIKNHYPKKLRNI